MMNAKQLVLSRVTVDEIGHENFVLKFRKKRRSYGEMTVPRSTLLNAKYMQKRISDLGGATIEDLPKLLADILNDEGAHTQRFTSRGGWHDDQLVTPFFVFPSLEPTREVSKVSHSFSEQHPLRRAREAKGSYHDLKSGLRLPLRYSRYLSLALLTALTPAIAQRLGRTGGYVFNICGGSRDERILCQRLAMAVMTSASERRLISIQDANWLKAKYRPSFGGACISFISPSASPRDESKNLRNLATLSYSNVELDMNGQKPPFSIQLTETDKPIRRSSRRQLQSDLMPLVDVEFSNETGLFDFGDKHADGLTSPRVLMQQTIDVLGDNYGVTTEYWVRFILDQPLDELASRFESEERKFIEAYNAVYEFEELTRSEQSNELRDICAAVYAAGAIASDGDLITLTREDIFSTLFWICLPRAEGEIFESTSESLKVPTRLNSFFGAILDFPEVQKGELADASLCAFGFRKKFKDAHFIFVREEFLASLSINPLFFQRTVLPELEKVNAIRRTKSGWIVQAEQMGISGRPYYYKFHEERLMSYFATARWNGFLSSLN
jgi:hypothetical protein